MPHLADLAADDIFTISLFITFRLFILSCLLISSFVSPNRPSHRKTMRPSILLSLLAAAGLAGAFVPSRPTLARAGVKMSMGTDVSRGDFVRAGAAAAAVAVLSPAEAAARSPTDLLREIVTTKPLNRKLIKWYSKNLSEDFTGSFAKGKIVLPKAAYIAVCEGLLASVPDFVYTCPSGEFREEDLGGVTTR